MLLIYSLLLFIYFLIDTYIITLLKFNTSVNIVYRYWYVMYICVFAQFIAISMCNMCLCVALVVCAFQGSRLHSRFPISFLWIIFFSFLVNVFVVLLLFAIFSVVFVNVFVVLLLFVTLCLIYWFCMYVYLLLYGLLFLHFFSFLFICFICFLSLFSFFTLILFNYPLYLFFSSFIFWSYNLLLRFPMEFLLSWNQYSLLGFAYCNICIWNFHESKSLLHNA